MKTIVIRRPYQHFNGNLYYVNDIDRHSVTEEWLVAYQALYEDYGMFVRLLPAYIDSVTVGKDFYTDDYFQLNYPDNPLNYN